MVSELLISYIFKFGFLISTLFAAAYGFIVFVSRPWLKPFLAAKFTNGLLECKLNNDGSATLSALKRYKGIAFNKDGEPVQEYKRFEDETEKELVVKEYNEKKLKKKDFQVRKIQPLFYHVARVGGIRIGFRREDDITFIDETGKPAPIDQAWLEKVFNIYYSAIMKLKKLFKKKAWDFPLWLPILLVVLCVAVFIGWRMITAGGV